MLASLLPTLDPLTLILESVPLYLLYELSIVLAAAWGRPLAEVPEEPAPEGSGWPVHPSAHACCSISEGAAAERCRPPT